MNAIDAPEKRIARIVASLKEKRGALLPILHAIHFRDTPPGRHTIHLCRAEACQAMNQRALEQHAKEQLGIDFHQTTADGTFTFEPVYCLGNCACAPSMLVDGELYGRVTPGRFDEIKEDWARR